MAATTASNTSAPHRVDLSISWQVVLLALFKTIALIYDVITLPIFLVIQRPWKKLSMATRPRARLERPYDPYSSWVRDHRPINPVDIKQVTLPEFVSIGQHFSQVFTDYGKKRCYGYREILGQEDEVQPNGKVFKKLILSDTYNWVTFEEAGKQVESLAGGLWSSGIRPGDKVVLWSDSRPEWMLMAQGVFRIGGVVSTLYSTLGDDGVVHGINETEATHIITSSDLLPKLTKLKERLTNLTTVIYMESPNPRAKSPCANCEGLTGLKTIAYSQLIEEGSRLSNFPKASPNKDDIAIIMYTSGSTGTPKGVMISHENVASAMRATNMSILTEFKLKDEDCFLAYLPQAHIFELICELSAISFGFALAYSSAGTMMDNSSALKKGVKGDVSLIKPTIMPSVPLILDRVRKAVVDKVSKSGRLQKGIFEFALDYKTYWTRKGFSTPLVDRFVFSSVKSVMGGKLRVIMVGGAPLSPETQEFCQNCLGAKVLQGYAATECTSITSAMDPDDLSYGRAGGPLFGARIRLRDWREGGYFATDKPNSRGEIIVGGEFVTKGYFKREEETKQCYWEEDGIRWWATGDIGEIYPDGTLRIIDRKKDLVKLQHGEYISLGKVESALKFCDYVDNICVHGDSFHNNVIALITPNKKQIKELAASLGKDPSLSFAQLCTDEDIVNSVKKSLVYFGTKCGLLRVEIPTDIKLCLEDWLPDNGLVTASLKVRRKQIEEYYKQDIIRMYSSQTASSKST